MAGSVVVKAVNLVKVMVSVGLKAVDVAAMGFGGVWLPPPCAMD